MEALTEVLKQVMSFKRLFLTGKKDCCYFRLSA